MLFYEYGLFYLHVSELGFMVALIFIENVYICFNYLLVHFILAKNENTGKHK